MNKKEKGSAMAETPKRDGYRMPGEFEPHAGCILIWPERPARGEMVRKRQEWHF